MQVSESASDPFERVRAGDESAIAAIRQLILGLVRRELLRAGVRPQDLPDGENRVLLRVVRSLGNGVVPRSVRAWLCAIARRVGHDIVNEEVCCHRFDEDAAAAMNALGRATMAAAAGVLWSTLDPVELLEGLAPLDREVAILKLIEERTREDVAERLHLTSGQVDHRMRFVRTFLHRRIEALRRPLGGGERERERERERRDDDR